MPPVPFVWTDLLDEPSSPTTLLVIMHESGVELETSTHFTYNIGGLQGEFVYLKADDNEFVVKTRKYTLENLINQTADAFISTGGIKEIASGEIFEVSFGGENMKTPMQPGFGQPMPGR